jgi:hypothetical protein
LIKVENAPLWISVYDRPNHFRLCIESLARNKEASNTILYISSDGPVDDLSSEKVSQVRDYIKSIRGFKDVIPFLPEENTRGEIKKKVINEVRSNHSKYILTEDDNVFSPVALNFFNTGLRLYESDQNVIAVSGYIYPGFPAKSCEQIFLRCIACWGIGLWRDKDLSLSYDEVGLSNEVLSNKELFRKVNNALPHAAPMIRAISNGQLTAGDVTRSIFAIKHNKYSVYPSVSLVRNIGHDGSGEHCGLNSTYSTQVIADQPTAFNIEKPTYAAAADEEWLANFFGGKWSKFYGWLIFWDLNAKYFISRLFFRGILKIYGLGYRIRLFLRQY